MTDNINPKHYAKPAKAAAIECSIFTLRLNFCFGNAFKYVWRHRSKNGLEDLEKAKWYLNAAMENEQTATDAVVCDVLRDVLRMVDKDGFDALALSLILDSAAMLSFDDISAAIERIDEIIEAEYLPSENGDAA